MRFKFPGRSLFLYISVVVVALTVIGRLFYLQVVMADEYRAEGDRQYTAAPSRVFSRGSIFFTTRDGQLISAATLKSGYILAINPSLLAVEPPNGGSTARIEDIYQKLSEIVEINKDEFLAKVNKKDDPYEEVATKLDEAQSQKIRDLKIKGVNVYRQQWRYYPAGKLASHVLGFVGYRGDDFGGRYGIEAQYDKLLSRDGHGLYTNFFAEVFSNVRGLLSGEQVQEGDVVLTIEPVVQEYVTRQLEELRVKWGAENAGAIVVDPKTGKIVAAVAVPEFDPNNVAAETSNEIFANPLVERVFEMGSVVKALTMAAGLDAGVVAPNTTYRDTGTLLIDRAQVSNFDGRTNGVVDMQEVLNKSINTGAVFVMRQLGREKFRDYFSSYGLGEKTGIELPGEVAGLIGNLKSPREVEYATASFGQGIALTPMGLTRALSSLANGGSLLRPYIVDRVNYKSGLKESTQSETGRQVISLEASVEISTMLSRAFDDALRGGTLKFKNYTIGTKTGTAQQSREGARGYEEGRVLHSFFGYFPVYDPEFLVFLYMMDPHGVRFSSESMPPVFLDITKFLISYYEIPPDR